MCVDCIYLTYDFLVFGLDPREIKNPPLWRMVNYSNANARKLVASHFRRNSWHRPRSRLWSGERKREA